MIVPPKLFGQIGIRPVKAMVSTGQLHFPTAEVEQEVEAPKTAAVDLMKLEEEPAPLWRHCGHGGCPGESIRITENHLPSTSILFVPFLSPPFLIFPLCFC